MSNPKISVIIPAFNLGEQIRPCLDSCINQGLKEVEVIVVNDGSTDQTQSIVAHYSKIDPRIILLNKTNGGVNLARKTGIEAAVGEYLFFLDGDDVIPQDSLHALLNAARLHNANLVAGDVLLFKKNNKLIKRSYHEFIEGDGLSFLEFILKQRLHYICGKLIKKTLFTDNPITFRKDLIVGEDQIQLCQICFFASTVVAINQVVYHYMLNDLSVTQRQTNPVVASKRLVILAESFWDLLQTHRFNDNVRQLINFRIIESLHHALRETGRFVLNEKTTRKMYRQVLLNGMFGKKSLLLSHFGIIPRAIFSYSFPKVFAACRRIVK
jgi:glycosyltransferase involved in cell wall biosynthesis